MLNRDLKNRFAPDALCDQILLQDTVMQISSTSYLPYMPSNSLGEKKNTTRGGNWTRPSEISRPNQAKLECARHHIGLDQPPKPPVFSS